MHIDLPRRASLQCLLFLGLGTLGLFLFAQAILESAVLSQAYSDLVLLDGRLGRLLDALAASARTMRIVRENLLWAVAYNVVALPLAVAGYVTPWLAGIGMGLSSLLVVLNALRLLHATPRAGGAQLEAGLSAAQPTA